MLLFDALTSTFLGLMCGKPHQDILLKYTDVYNYKNKNTSEICRYEYII